MGKLVVGVGRVSDFSTVTQLESNKTKISIQGFMTSESVLTTKPCHLPYL